jgi:hypothetical protein
LTAITCPSGLCAIDTIDGSGLRTAVGRREADPVRYVGNRITIGVDLEFVDRIRRKGLGCSGSGWVNANGRMHVHHQDCPVLFSGAGKDEKISEVKPRISVGEPKIRTGVMV